MYRSPLLIVGISIWTLEFRHSESEATAVPEVLTSSDVIPRVSNDFLDVEYRAYRRQMEVPT